MTKEQIIARQKELLAQARAAGRAMDADERAEFDSLQRALDNITADGADGNPGNGTAQRAEEDNGNQDGSNEGE